MGKMGGGLQFSLFLNTTGYIECGFPRVLRTSGGIKAQGNLFNADKQEKSSFLSYFFILCIYF